MKHTPGPWFIAKHGPRFRIIRARGGQEIARSVKSQYFDLRPDEEQQSNLRLLAAAPKMLAALEKAAEFIRDQYECLEAQALEGGYLDKKAQPIWTIISEAIAEARSGESDSQ
jgi:hypothetical protein